MRLSQLLAGIHSISPHDDRTIAGLTLDSRQVKANDAFVALKGVHYNGLDYIPQAIAKNASAILIEADHASISAITRPSQIPFIPVKHLRQQLGVIAARFYDEPATKLTMLGVTGTNGKTSCAHFMAQVLDRLQKRCGLIGTLGSGFYGSLTETGMTTPDAIVLQSTLRHLLDQGAQAVAMEVSSHSIHQGRINGIDFATGIFTNLTQDHLDYHGDMQTYAKVKHHFLAQAATHQVIINADDAYGAQWINELKQEKPVFAYATQPSSFPLEVSMLRAEEIALSLQGIQANILSPWGEGVLSLPLIGRFNLSNALAVLTALCAQGFSFTQVLTHLEQLQAVPGRMQMLRHPGKPLVVVDYAHTPDALEKVLQALRAHTLGKLICVFGCGGDRDHGKRPLMASIAEKWADQIIVTNDNPRHENPETIAQQILTGFVSPHQVQVILDRSKAIQNSIQWASAGDCVLIAGKGAEHYQQMGDEKIPFDDAKQVQHYLS